MGLGNLSGFLLCVAGWTGWDGGSCTGSGFMESEQLQFLTQWGLGIGIFINVVPTVPDLALHQAVDGAVLPLVVLPQSVGFLHSIEMT